MKLRCSDINSEFGLVKNDLLRGCYRPRKVRYFDVVSETYQYMYVPCGKCVYCCSLRQQDWVTRMSMQSITSKYTYFVTLTFSSDFLRSDSKIADFLMTIENKGKLLPLLVHKKPLQDFIKRLRNYTKYDFKYFAVGEYGDTYSRPHYHLLVWSDDLINYNDIAKAWSLHGLQIGRIQFDNLRFNGTLNNLYRDSDSSTDSDSSHCFKYCAKYCTKLFKNMNLYTLNHLKKVYNEKIVGKVFERPFNKINASAGNYIYESFSEFLECFQPFVLCSTKSPIGVEYIKDSLQEWNHEVPDKIEMYGNVFPTPKIAKKVWKDTLFPYRVLSGTNGRVTCVGNPLAVCRQLFNALDDFYVESPHYFGANNMRYNSNYNALIYDKSKKQYYYYDARSQAVEVFQYDNSSRNVRVPVAADGAYCLWQPSGIKRVGFLSCEEFLNEYATRAANYISFLQNQQKQMNESDLELVRNIVNFKAFNKLDDFSFPQFVKRVRDTNTTDVKNRIQAYIKRKTFKNRHLGYECI